MDKEDRNLTPADPVAQRPPDAELEVLACLWQFRKATARQIREMMHDYRPMAHGSMVTLLKRLEAKGLVMREKGPVGKAFVYSPTQSARPTYRRILRDMVQRIFGGNGIEMVSTFFEASPPTAREMDKLQELLDQLRSGAEKREG